MSNLDEHLPGDASDPAIEELKRKLEAAGHFVDPFGFVDLQGAAYALACSKRNVERKLKVGEFLPQEVRSRCGSRRISVAGLLRWHLDGLIPESRAA